jgi:hypothetical protein
MKGHLDMAAVMRGAWASLQNIAIHALEKMLTEAITTAIMGKAVDKVANTSKTFGNIAVASTGAASAVAAVPFVGPALAAAAAAETEAALTAMAAPLLAARGGFDVPSGINPLTQLHEQEMVLPASLANPFRNMLAFFNPVANTPTFNAPSLAPSPAAAAGGGMEVHNHFHGVWDGESVRRFVESNDYRKATRETARNGLR